MHTRFGLRITDSCYVIQYCSVECSVYHMILPHHMLSKNVFRNKLQISDAVRLALLEYNTPLAALIFFGVRRVSRRFGIFWIAAIHCRFVFAARPRAALDCNTSRVDYRN